MELTAANKLVLEHPLFLDEVAPTKTFVFPKVLKIALVAPFLICGLAVMFALAILLTPLIPLVEIWRLGFLRR